MDERRAHEVIGRIKSEVKKVLVGKDETLELLLAAIIADGHVLLEDVPGLGKTVLAKTLSRALGCTYSRIQFTPDLMPGDVTGVTVYNQRTADFEFHPGPVTANVVLADEINRATPRTQSSLLEAMEERQVTVDGVTRPLPRPFCVIATQNPVEQEGTFPLPEAQVDRFLMKLSLGYPGLDEEREIVRRFVGAGVPLDTVAPAANAGEIGELTALALKVTMVPAVEDYLLAITRATREDGEIALGASPRGALALARVSRALALLGGRSFVRPDDVRRAAGPVLAHRLILSAEARLRGHRPTETVERLLAAIPVPVEDAAE